LEYVYVLVFLVAVGGVLEDVPVGQSWVSIHSGERNAVPQLGLTTPQSPCSPNSGAYHQSLVVEGAEDLV
jgi:hypothetical protein